MGLPQRHATITMCSHYQAVKDAERLRRHFGVGVTERSSTAENRPVARIPRAASSACIHMPIPEMRRCHNEHLGGIVRIGPTYWAKDIKSVKNTFNARSETTADKPSFRDAWRKSMHHPSRSLRLRPTGGRERNTPTRITTSNGSPLGIAGLWSTAATDGAPVFSFTLLTINATAHPMMRNFPQTHG
jgi:putative SOS response-associated peptidase YedK